MSDLIERPSSIGEAWRKLIQQQAEIERVETFSQANWAALQEAQRQIKQLEGDLQVTRLQGDARMVSEFVVDDAVKAEIERLRELNDRSMSVCQHLSISGSTKGMNKVFCASCQAEYWIPSAALEGDDERLRATR